MATTTELNYPTSFNRELILDLTLQAFSVYNFDHEDDDADAPRVHDYIPIAAAIKEDAEDTVLDENGVVVTDAAATNVTVTVKITSNRTRESRKENFKFLTTQSTNFTLSEYKDFTFMDWVSYDATGFDFSSFLVTGYDISQDFLRKKQAIYLLVDFLRTEEWYTLSGADVVLARQSSCLVQSRWGWNDSAVQGKWGTQFQAYRLVLPQPASPASGDEFDYGPIVIETKNKLRGSGKALSLYFQSVTQKDMKLLGWGIDGYKVDTP